MSSLLMLPAILAAAAAGADAGVCADDSSSDIAGAVEQLGDDSFSRRESASLFLFRAGPRAIPELTVAARSDDAEVRSRAFAILLAFARTENDEHVFEAHTALRQLADDDDRRLARRAQAAVMEVQQRLVTELKRLGVTVSLDEHGEAVEINADSKQITDRHLSRLRLLPKLIALNLSRTTITNKGLASVAQLPELQSLTLRYTSVTGEGVAHLKDVALKRLNLQGVALIDADAEILGAMTSLELLSIEKTEITDAGLKQFGELVNLETLYLGESLIRGESLATIAKLPKLRYLSLRKLQIGDASLAALTDCEQLESLGLDETPVSDACLPHLAKLTNLRVLWLTNTQIGDNIINTVSNLTSLENLYVRGTKVTEDGVMRLKGARPGVEISQ